MHIYEYLFAAVMIAVILVSSSTMISTISEPARTTSEKEQLKVAAQKLMAQILLDPGEPVDWGADVNIKPEDLKVFGLAKYGETRDAYIMDRDKVLRLDSNNPLYIPPSAAVNLLNLGIEYGFALEIHPALNVGVSQTSNLDKYEVMVKSPYGEIPIVSASVTAKIYYLNSGEIASTKTLDETTNHEGKCIIDFNGVFPEAKVLTLIVNYYGIRVVKIFTGEKTEKAYTLGNHLLTESIDESKNVTQLLVTEKDGKCVFENVASSLRLVKAGDYNLTSFEPSAVGVLGVSQDLEAETRLVYAFKGVCEQKLKEEAEEKPFIKYSSIPELQFYPSFTYSLERAVLIGESAYAVRLYLWRMSF